MDQVRVNLTLDEDVWDKFTQMVPKREKSRTINDLLKQEVVKMERCREQQTLATAFRDASEDPERLAAIREWKSLDEEGWEG